MNKKNYFTYLYFLIIILWIAFIFSNSLASPEASSESSGKITEFINNLMKKLNLDISISELFVRKFAHFFAFFILGSLLFNTIPLLKKEIRKTYIYVAYFGLIIAVTDESLQLISKRGSSLLDVLLDYSGFIISNIICAIIIQLLRIQNKKAR